ncbi:hypothetical protein M5K25_020607 [Dendrobium thyrsiflorum]|uniref:Uncharacterized protein n=1 Tax=Dendrobium thyrsiflorum TaxID=117978 RepID=A0ABD0UH76_DENTH
MDEIASRQEKVRKFKEFVDRCLKRNLGQGFPAAESFVSFCNSSSRFFVASLSSILPWGVFKRHFNVDAISNSLKLIGIAVSI